MMVNPPKNPGPYPITAEYLRSILSYNSSSGVFVWLVPPWNHPRLAGAIAGCNSTGYTLIRIDGRKYKAHRLAWLFVYGEWPAKRIDHRDGDPFNNAIANLRLATQAQNCANAARWGGKELPKGVRRSGARFQARISFQKRQIALGVFDSIEEAASAYLRAAQKFYGEFARAA